MSAKSEKNDQLSKISSSKENLVSADDNENVAATEANNLYRVQLKEMDHRQQLAMQRASAKEKKEDGVQEIALRQQIQQENKEKRGKIGEWFGDTTHTVVYISSFLIFIILIAVFFFAYSVPKVQEDVVKGLLGLLVALVGFLGGRLSK